MKSKYILYDGDKFLAQGTFEFIEEVMEDLSKMKRRFDFVIKPKKFFLLSK